MVLKLRTIVTPKNCNFCIELRFYGVIEVLENRGSLWFINEKDDLSKTGMNINKGHKPLFSREGSVLCETLNVTVDEGEQLGWFIWL